MIKYNMAVLNTSVVLCWIFRMATRMAAFLVIHKAVRCCESTHGLSRDKNIDIEYVHGNSIYSIMTFTCPHHNLW